MLIQTKFVYSFPITYPSLAHVHSDVAAFAHFQGLGHVDTSKDYIVKYFNNEWRLFELIK